MAIRLSGMVSGMDTDAMVKELVSAYSLKKESYVKDNTKLDWKKDAWKELNTKVYKFYTGSLNSMKLMTSFASKKKCNVSDPNKVSVSANGKVPNGTQSIQVKALAQAGYLTGNKIATTSGKDVDYGKTTMSDMGLYSGKIQVNTADGVKDFTIKAGEKISEFTERFQKETGIAASFDSGQQRFVFNSKSGVKNDFNFVADTAEQLAGLEKLGLATQEQYTKLGKTPPAQTATKQDASDASIIVNGATYTSDSNTINVNGLTINAMGITDKQVSVTTSTDTDEIYKMVKGFITEYNDIINEMTELYNAPTAKDYNPLTDEEKEAMSEKEVESWEKKIKDSLLRRDDTLGSVMESMKAGMSAGIKIEGKQYYLSSFGISTMGIMGAEDNKQNAYHIDGDKDDTSRGDAKDKLRTAIEADPDKVATFFNEMAQGFYDTMTKKMKSTELRSAYTIYNDKDMNNQQIELKKQISSWDKKITEYEDSWYKKFAAMESAMSKLQSQTSSLTSLLGGK
ncbi:MAG: flagellar filament capping protein FliD [Lachnospiraceae bacterium]